MAEDWFADVQKYNADADAGVVKKIVSYLGIALRNRDSSLVSFSDPEEVGRVRERFLRKKLELTDSDETLNSALDAVKTMMSGDRTKNRVTVYYLLADWFGKLDLFGGTASNPGAFTFANIGGKPFTESERVAYVEEVEGTSVDAAISEPSATPQSIAATTPAAVAAAAAAPPAAAMAAAGGSTEVGGHAGGGDDGNRYGLTGDGGGGGDDHYGGGGFPSWLKWLLLLAALVLLFLLVKSCMGHKDADDGAMNAAAGTEMTADGNLTGSGDAMTGTDAAAAATAVPAGAGVVASEAAGKPTLTVYFDVGKKEVSNDLAAQAATLKAYLDANAGSTLAVSGYNDPSGNAAANAELSKNRAQAVKAALVAAGISDASIELVKPADTTSGSVTPEQARRVEVTIQ
nr:DUF2853 family protein [uncultured Sphingomonas sp.]